MPPEGPAAPTWVKILAAVFGGLTLLFFMGLVLLSVFGHPVPDDSRYLVAFIFGIFGGLAFAFISGTAAASGYIPIPNTAAQIQFSAGGGIAATVLFAVLGWYIIPTGSLPVQARIDQVHPFPGQDPTAVTVQVAYQLVGNDPSHRAVLEAGFQPDLKQPAYRKNLSDPAAGQATFELPLDGADPGAPFYVRLHVENRQGQVVATSNTWEAHLPRTK